MHKSNFEITDKESGKSYWISRAIVVIPFTFKIIDGKLYTLIEQRGEAVSNTDKWCCPCGYLDWGETLEEACAREIHEETGIQIDIKDIHFVNYNGRPESDSRQNVGMRFICFVPPYTQLNMSNIETKDEIKDLQWKYVGYFGYTTLNINKSELDDVNGKWAFNHNQLIIDILTSYYKDRNVSVIVS